MTNHLSLDFFNLFWTGFFGFFFCLDLCLIVLNFIE